MSQLFHQVAKLWEFIFNISLSSEHPGLISFRMDWLDLLAVPGTLKSLLQHHSSKPSILRCSAFFTVQLSHPYIQNQYFSTSKINLFLLVAKSCLTLLRPHGGSSVPGILQARILAWAAVSFARGSSGLMDKIPISWVSCIAGGFFTTEPQMDKDISTLHSQYQSFLLSFLNYIRFLTKEYSQQICSIKFWPKYSIFQTPQSPSYSKNTSFPDFE